MLLIKTSRKKLKVLSIILAVILFLIVALITYLVFGTDDQTIDVNLSETEVKIEPELVSSNVLFVGNIFFGRYINDWSMESPLKYAYPFSRLNEFNREQYDAWVAGLECPVVSGVNMSSQEMNAYLKFNCSPDYLPEAAKWFNIFTLANNHTDNQNGSVGFSETQSHLEKNGIQYFGHYDPRVIDDVCEVISLPVKITNNDKSFEKAELPVAMCGYDGVFRIPSPESAAVISGYSKYMPVIAMPHMGAEYRAAADQIKTNFYRSLIDNGADVVIGDHPHWVQNTESYKGHLIVYSMGNFLFDQLGTVELTRSAAIKTVLTVENVDSELLNKWIELGKECKVYKDDCLASAKADGLTKLPYNFQFSVVGSNDEKRITKPSTPEQLNGILQRLNWQSTIKQLQPPYSGI